jgi:hypothetical protein
MRGPNTWDKRRKKDETVLSGQSRLYRLISFIAFVVFFFQIITNFSFEIFLSAKPLTA